MNQRPVVIVAASLAATMLWANAADACSCAGDNSPAILAPSGTTFPSNFLGVPCINLKDVPRDRITIIHLTEDLFRNPVNRKKLDVRIETPPLPEEYASKHNPWYRSETGRVDEGRVSLICTDWQPGGTYRVRIENEEILIHVSSQPFEAAAHQIEVWENEHAEVLTSTSGGSCSIMFPGHRVGVELAGHSVDQWRHALLYLTVVDDAMAWRPEYDICSDVPPGMSWVGPARELLYGRCAAGIDGALWNLTPGYHIVTMMAWLPGVSEIQATATIFIDCK